MRNLMTAIARVMAILGGAVLSLLILLTCVSILGRSLNGIFHNDWVVSMLPNLSAWMVSWVGPVNGDYELVEAGVAFAIFAFIPLCQITAGHASVDIFTNSMPHAVNRLLRAVIEPLFAVVLVVIAWRLGAGAWGKFENAETSFLLQFPVWWAYAASFLASVMAAIVGIYMGCVRVYEFLTGRIIIWDGTEAEK